MSASEGPNGKILIGCTFQWLVCLGLRPNLLRSKRQVLPALVNSPAVLPFPKSLTPAGKSINEPICGKKRKVNESGWPPSANGPRKRKEAKGVWFWIWGEGDGGWLQTAGNQGADAGRGPRHCSQLALISQEQVSCVRSA